MNGPADVSVTFEPTPGELCRFAWVTWLGSPDEPLKRWGYALFAAVGAPLLWLRDSEGSLVYDSIVAAALSLLLLLVGMGLAYRRSQEARPGLRGTAVLLVFRVGREFPGFVPVRALAGPGELDRVRELLRRRVLEPMQPGGPGLAARAALSWGPEESTSVTFTPTLWEEVQAPWSLGVSKGPAAVLVVVAIALLLVGQPVLAPAPLLLALAGAVAGAYRKRRGVDPPEYVFVFGAHGLRIAGPGTRFAQRWHELYAAWETRRLLFFRVGEDLVYFLPKRALAAHPGRDGLLRMVRGKRP